MTSIELGNKLNHTHQVPETTLFRVTAAVAGKAARAWWRRLPSDRKAQLRWLTVVLESIREESVLYYRQGARRHQGKFGLLCGVGLVGVYQGYASHVLQCPGGLKDHERIMHEIIR